MISFSEITEADVEAVSEIEARTFSMPWKAEDFLEMINLDYAYYIVARVDDEIVGCCGVRNMCGDGEITNVVRKEEFRGRGIVETMLKYLMDSGRERGIRRYTLEVRRSNAPAISLYEKLGFSCEGVRPRFYEKPVEDALIYWKP